MSDTSSNESPIKWDAHSKIQNNNASKQKLRRQNSLLIKGIQGLQVKSNANLKEELKKASTLSVKSSGGHLVGNVLQSKIDELKDQLDSSKLFTNMVVHDMRNPTGAIEFGIKQSLENIEAHRKDLMHVKGIIQRYDQEGN